MPRIKKHKDQAKDNHKAGDLPMSFTSYRDVLPVTEDMEDHPRLLNWKEVVKQHWKKGVYLTLFLAYNVYFGFAIKLSWDQSTDWCQGVRLLIIITTITYVGLLYYVIIKPLYGQRLYDRWLQPFSRGCNFYWEKKLIRWITFALLITLVIVFYIIDTWKSRQRLVSLSGLASILILGVIFSKDWKKIIWRHVVWGIGIQFVIGLLVLRWPIGAQFFQCISDKIQSFLSNSDAGATFVFDYLASGNISFFNTSDVNSNLTLSLKSIVIESVFAFKVLPVILFFSFFISILYYWGIMQQVIMQLGWLLQISIGTTAAESMNAAASVFVGMTEAPLMIKPFIPLMTKSEIHAVMAGGFATIAGTVFAAYISFGINGAYLLSGAIMSAPAGLAMSKIVYPETEESRTTFRDIKIDKREERSVLEAAANGALSAVTLAAGIASGLITFIAFITFVDGIVSWMASLVGLTMNIEMILGKIFIPLAYVMGVEWKDCDRVGYLIGVKTIINEFVAYKKLEEIKELISPRSRAIATYALCSFANISSVGTQIAVLSAMIPERKGDFADVAVRAVCTGAAACFLTACMAGSLLNDSGYS